MRTLLYSALSLLSLAFLIACGSDSTKRINQPGGDHVDLCPPTQIMGPNGCVPRDGLVPDAIIGPVSFVMERNDPYGPETGQMSLVGDYERFIRKAMQTCERYDVSWGSSDCDKWVRGYQRVMITFDSALDNLVDVEIYSEPVYTPYYFDFGFSTSGMPFNPLELQMYAHPWNNGLGFEIRSNGSNFNTGWGSLVQFQVKEGKLVAGQNFLDVEMLFEGEVIAQGRMQRCQNYGCFY